MRRFVIALSVLILVLAGLSSAYASAPTTPAAALGGGKISGVVPTRAIAAQRALQQAALRPTRVNNLVYHNGPVMHTNKTFAIYWVPSGFVISSSYNSIINKYFQDVATDSGKTSNVYYSTTQYFDNTNGNILYSSSFGGSVLDTNPFPTSGCSDTVSQTTVCLSDAQLQSEINRVATAQGWPRGSTSMFFLFTAKNVGSCYDSANCAFSQYCAYHSSFGTGASTTIYANQPYADTVTAACDAGQHPNGNDADATINVTSHEHAEAITDYLGNAWYDRTGAENGDKCAWTFGTALGNTGSGLYNQAIGTGKYYLQREWSNRISGCVLTGT
jgi:hypothetical protein